MSEYAIPFWLSHHRTEEAHKTFEVAGLHVCSRCLGTYPVMMAVLVQQLKRPLAPPELPYDALLLFALPIPALVDWTVGQLTRWRGSNLLRVVTGVLLGISLGRMAYINMRHPADPKVLAQLAGLTAIAGIVWGIRQVLGLAANKPGSGAPPVDPDGPPVR